MFSFCLCLSDETNIASDDVHWTQTHKLIIKQLGWNRECSIIEEYLLQQFWLIIVSTHLFCQKLCWPIFLPKILLTQKFSTHNFSDPQFVYPKIFDHFFSINLFHSNIVLANYFFGLQIFVQRLRSKPWTYKSKFFMSFIHSFCIQSSRLRIG